LAQLFGNRQVLIVPSTTVGGPAGAGALVLAGSNPLLEPERAEQFTAGFDIEPRFATGLALSGTYFSIEYDGRLGTPIPTLNASLSNAIYSDFVSRTPSASMQSAAIADATLITNVLGAAYNPANVVALVNNRTQNISQQTAEGVDFDISYRRSLGPGNILVRLNGTRISLKQRLLMGAPVAQLSGMIFNTPTLKFRGGLSYVDSAFSISGFVNRTSASIDNVASPNLDIDGFTTVDAQISYKFRWLNRQETKISLSAQNLFDVDPPFVKATSRVYNGVSYDQTNASPLGRVVSLNLTIGW
jgi:iron complex outermembrane receptor protein